MKDAWDFGSFLTENGSTFINSNGIEASSTSTERNHHNSNGMLPTRMGSQSHENKPDCLESCSSTENMRGHLFHNCSGDSAVMPATQRPVTTPTSSFPPLTRALWAGVKTSEGNHYTITHAQPFDQKLQRTSLPPITLHNSQQPDEDSAGYTTLHPSATTSFTASSVGNQIYYCCTDLMIIQQSPTSSAVQVQQVTSLDDPADLSNEENPNPLYVNMSNLHPLATPKLSYPLVNPIYPSPCRLQVSHGNANTNQVLNSNHGFNLNSVTARQHTHQA